MGIGKGKSDKIDIDGLIGGTGNKDEALRVERCLTEKMEELKLTTAALNAAIDRIGSIVSNFMFQISIPLFKKCRQRKSAHRYIQKP